MAIDFFSRMPSGAFDDIKKEKYALLRSQGKTVIAISKELPGDYQTLLKWDHNPVMKDRVRGLQDAANTYAPVSLGSIVRELQMNISMARDAGQFKASTDAVKVLYDLICREKDLLKDSPAPALESGDNRPAALRLVESLEQARLTIKDVFTTSGEEVEKE